YSHTPALLAWLCALASWPAGAVSQLTAALPSAVAGVGLAFVVYALGRGMFGADAGRYAALVAVATQGFFLQARLPLPDMLMTLFITTALWHFWRMTRSDAHAAHWVGFYGFTAAAFWTKGPAGFLPLAVVLGWALVNRRDAGWRLAPRRAGAPRVGGRHVRRRRRVAPAAAALLPAARAADRPPDRLVAGERRPQAPRGGPHALAGVRRARPAPRLRHGRHAARERAVAPGRRGLAAGLARRAARARGSARRDAPRAGLGRPLRPDPPRLRRRLGRERHLRRGRVPLGGRTIQRGERLSARVRADAAGAPRGVGGGDVGPARAGVLVLLRPAGRGGGNERRPRPRHVR